MMHGYIGNTQSHSHHAIQIFVSLQKPLSFNVDGNNLSSPYLIVNKNIPHYILDNEGKIITIIIDDDSNIAKHISTSILKSQKYISIDTYQIDKIKIKSKEDAQHVLNTILTKVSDMDSCICKDQDERVINAIDIIGNTNEKKISIDDLASKVFLSSGRLTHLFKEQVGIPLRKYLLWRRLWDALNIIVDGKEMTFAAHEAGFSDSAHLSRTFKETFGLNLSKIFKNSRFIQLISMNK